MKYNKSSSELVLGNIPQKVNIPEIKVTYDRTSKYPFLGTVTSSKDVADFLKSVFPKGTLQLNEHMIVIYLNRANRILGYYRHSTGGISSTVTDHRLILATALKVAASGIILVHNHPSGNSKPSQADHVITKTVKDAAKLLDINLLDHFIVTNEGHYSFADEGLLGLSRFNNSAHELFTKQVRKDLSSRVKHNKISLQKLAATFDIYDQTEVKELTELAIVLQAREIAHQPADLKSRFEKIVELYQLQSNLSHRTSQSILLQQYSTPAPIAFLAGIFAGLDKLNPERQEFGFEPSAGNGLLTIAGKPENIIVNEIDSLRHANLKTQGYKEVFKVDSSISIDQNPTLAKYNRTFKAVVSNPPFGSLKTTVKYDGYPIKDLDHLMALRALEAMANDGKASIIIGGHTKYDAKGRVQAGKNRIFLNYLYRYFHVPDIIPIDGSKLYSRQGTSFDVRLILINGRKITPEGAAPLRDSQHDKEIKSFSELYNRIQLSMIKTEVRSLSALEQEAIELLKKLNDNEPLSGRSEKAKLDYQKMFERFTILKSVEPQDLILFLAPEKYLYVFGEDAEYLHKWLRYPYFNPKENNYGFKMCRISYQKRDDLLYWVGLHKKTVFYAPFEDQFQAWGQDLGMVYTPTSASTSLDTHVPDSMGFEIHAAMKKVKEEVGGDVDNFVRHRLGYTSTNELYRALSAEQIDAVAMAIYNIEARSQGMIIGDQTGIGKGRIAAAMIRYGVLQGHKPIFITEKANLFSDIYRDLAAIGSAHLVPLIINSKESKSDIKDSEGEIIYQAPTTAEQSSIFASGKIPGQYNFVMATYTQFNSPEKKPEKPAFLRAITTGNIMIMDEAHNSSGSSNTGTFMQGIVHETKGIVFLSATFAKRPDNMPIYAMKTAISDCNMTSEALVDAITSGGVALQEIISSQLVAEGQMIRRERSFEGVEVNYITLSELEKQHYDISDRITEILRDIIAFQSDYIDQEIDELDKIAAREGKEMGITEGTSKAGVDNQPYFSKVFQVINQMLFSLKAEAVAERAIMRLREGKKPVIAFASTMGSFIEQMENQDGLPVREGDVINTDFTEVLKRGLDGVMRYSQTDVDGSAEHHRFDLSDLPAAAQNEYIRISEKIWEVSAGISISPIDIIIQKLEKAGYSVAEVTGRKFELQINTKENKGILGLRKKINTNDAFRQFNNNQIDVLMINQSGSTGASAHAIVTSSVPESEVKQRVMIVLQAELDINTEVQKRGRINRTGQILKPIYDYINSSIPAEKRLMMMLQKKLKSLDANTTSNQKQSTKILDVPDFLNKYGDKIVKEYLLENPDINTLLGNPLNMGKKDLQETTEDAAHKVSGRVAVLSTKMQADFYNDISERYSEMVEYLMQTGEYDLEVEAMNLEAETIKSRPLIVGKGGESVFGHDSVLELVKANVLRKPFSGSDLRKLINESLNGQEPIAQQQSLLAEFSGQWEDRRKKAIDEITQDYKAKSDMLIKSKDLLHLLENHGEKAFEDELRAREEALKQNLDKKLDSNNRQSHAQYTYLLKLLNFFFTGRMLYLPPEDKQRASEDPAVFLGFVIDRRKANPFLPSNLKLRFAIASSRKYLAVPASFTEFILATIGNSSGTSSSPIELDRLIQFWEEKISKTSSDKSPRYIITANILQAYSGYKGKLVSYTTIDNQVKKGILMPEIWEPKNAIGMTTSTTSVPILAALPVILALENQKGLEASHHLNIFHSPDGIRLIVPSSRQKGGDIYLNADLLRLVENNKFESKGSNMIGLVREHNIEKVVDVLQTKLGVNVLIGPSNLEKIDRTALSLKRRKLIALPPPPEKLDTKRIRLLELEAEALLLELELAA